MMGFDNALDITQTKAKALAVMNVTTFRTVEFIKCLFLLRAAHPNPFISNGDAIGVGIFAHLHYNLRSPFTVFNTVVQNIRKNIDQVQSICQNGCPINLTIELNISLDIFETQFDGTYAFV